MKHLLLRSTKVVFLIILIIYILMWILSANDSSSHFVHTHKESQSPVNVHQQSNSGGSYVDIQNNSRNLSLKLNAENLSTVNSGHGVGDVLDYNSSSLYSNLYDAAVSKLLQQNWMRSSSGELFWKRKHHSFISEAKGNTISSEERNFLAQRMSVYISRQAQVVKVCRQHARALKRLGTSSELLWDTTHHIGFCRNAKAATTNWLQKFLVWSQNFTANMTSNEIHVLASKVFPPLDTAAANQELKRGHSFVFTVVRHPFTRLVSAYREKILQRYKPDVQEQIIMSSRKDANTSLESLVTFREFIQFVTDRILECRPNLINSACLSKVDVHWRPYFDRCAPCDINYDVISKVETFDEDEKSRIFNLSVKDYQV